MTLRWKIALGVWAANVFAFCVVPALALDITAREVTGLLFASAVGVRPDLSGKDLNGLDLAGLDFKAAVLAKSNLFGADLSGANLSGADLSGANLDRVTLIATRLDGANLEGARLLRPSVFSTLASNGAEAPSFKGANMRGIKMFGRFTRVNFEGADLTGATCAPFGKTGFIEEIWRTEMSGANLVGVHLDRADLTHALLSFADMRGAHLNGTILKNADLTGADLTGADVTGADFEVAIVNDVKGFNTIIGLRDARNTDKILK